jgi:hypothetical protein
MRTFVDAYGLELDPERLIRAVRLNHDRMYRLIEDGAGAGNQGFAAYWAESEQRVAATRVWYAEQHDALVAALSV